jgi:hypothetical protein
MRPTNFTSPRLSREAEPINDALKGHSCAAQDWDYHDTVSTLHQWAERFNVEFDLGVQTPAIALNYLRACRLGAYRHGRNPLGLKHEITLNARYLGRPLGDQLSTLLHELLHEWQHLYGKAGQHNYHNRQFQNKALLYGLVVDHRGHTNVRPGRFTDLLASSGVDLGSVHTAEDHPVSARPVGYGHSKMQKYRCCCTTVRCATELAAHCDKCGTRFEPALAAW